MLEGNVVRFRDLVPAFQSGLLFRALMQCVYHQLAQFDEPLDCGK